jgi:hypothetical protein
MSGAASTSSATSSTQDQKSRAAFVVARRIVPIPSSLPPRSKDSPPRGPVSGFSEKGVAASFRVSGEAAQIVASTTPVVS